MRNLSYTLLSMWLYIHVELKLIHVSKTGPSSFSGGVPGLMRIAVEQLMDYGIRILIKHISSAELESLMCDYTSNK